MFAADIQGNSAFFFNLLLGLGELLASIHGGSLGLASLLLLSCKHFLSLDLCLLHGLLLSLSFQSFLLSISLFDQGLLFLLFPGQFLLLLCSDFLPLGLFLLQSLELILFLGSLVPPLCDVFFELFIQFILLHTSFSLCKCLISLGRSLGGV